MPSFTTRRTVRHSADDMFDLVADVEKYPQFVPLCQSLRVRRRTPAEVGIEILVADMTVAYKMIRETFTSKVTLDRPRLQIFVQYLDGPFQRMENRWSFVSTAENRCEVEFAIDYEFKSRMFGMLMGAMFETAFRKFSSAFEARADKVYGKGPSPKSA